MNDLTLAPPRRAVLWLVPVVMLLTAVIVRKSGGGLHSATLFVALAASVAVVSAGYVLLQLPTVYTLGSGLVLSIFSGNWQSLGLPGIPDRFLLLAAIGLLLAREREQLARFRLTAAHVLLLITVVYATVSAAAGGLLGTRTTTFTLIDQLGAVPFLLFFVVPLIVRTREERQVLLYFLVGLGLYLGIEAMLEALHANSLVLPHYIVDPSVGTVDGRVRGPFTSPVTEGFALFGCATASAIVLSVKSHRLARTGATLVIPLCLLGCFFTLERGIWIAAVVSVFGVGLTTTELRRTVVPTMLVGAALVLGALAFVPGLQQRAAKRSQTTLSVWDRQNQDAAALRMIRARPLLGFGWGTFPTASLPYFRQAPGYPMTGYGIILHDLYLSNAVELGLIGFGLWLLAQVFAFVTTLGSRAPPELRPWKIGLGAMIIFTAVAELFNPLEQNFSQLLLWSWAGVILGAVWHQESPTVPPVPRRSPLRSRRLPSMRLSRPAFDPRVAYEPWLRVRIRPRKVALAMLGVVAGGALGVAIAQLTSSSAPSFDQPFTQGIVQVVLPGGWHQASRASGFKLGLTDQFVLQRGRPVAATLTIGTNVESGGALLPPTFLAHARSPLAEIVNSGSLIYYRYRGLTAFGRSSTVYALPTSYGTIVAVCGARGSGTRAAAASCEQVLRTVSLTAGNTLQLGADVHYARALNQVITRLNSARASGGARLAHATASGAQAQAADALAAAHARAAAGLAHLSLGVGGPANSALAAALRATAHAYGALGRAAAANDAAGYGQAAKAVRSANTALSSALAELSRLGYLVG
ncbi:MAG: O-antigen ligase family protein [Solirubrobacteraceae bacterium]